MKLGRLRCHRWWTAGARAIRGRSREFCSTCCFQPRVITLRNILWNYQVVLPLIQSVLLVNQRLNISHFASNFYKIYNFSFESANWCPSRKSTSCSASLVSATASSAERKNKLKFNYLTGWIRSMKSSRKISENHSYSILQRSSSSLLRRLSRSSNDDTTLKISSVCTFRDTRIRTSSTFEHCL